VKEATWVQLSRAIQALTHYANGILTRVETVHILSELSEEALNLLPPMPPSHPPKEGIREEALRLKGAVANGSTIKIGSNSC